MSRYWTLLVVVTLAVCAQTANAQKASELSADLPDAKTLEIQEKVEKLYRLEEYERAFFIYRNELAPIGDKYAQYMVGYMYESGLGVASDPATAAAWYKLAAERGTPEFIYVRDHMIESLSAIEQRRFGARYLDVQRRYSDLVVVLKSIKEDLRELKSRTGSRLGSGSGPIQIVDMRTGRMTSSNDYYRSIRERLKTRLLMLREIGDFPDLDVSGTNINVAELEKMVILHLESREN